jgi:hypothetical protein
VPVTSYVSPSSADPDIPMQHATAASLSRTGVAV